MSGGKQKLRPWLEEMISRGEVPGLCWLNAEKNKFRIPWKHGGKQDWSPDNSRIFMEWAKHTGKYREGVDDPNYPTWKTRLRCAFNKAPDIQEVKDESQLNCHEPFRVYILTQGKRAKPDSKGPKGNGRGSGGGGGARKGGGGMGAGEEEDDYSSSLKAEVGSDVKKMTDIPGIPTMVSAFDNCSNPTDSNSTDSNPTYSNPTFSNPTDECLSPADFQSLFQLTPETTQFMLQEVVDEGIVCQFDGTFPSDASTGEPTTIMNYLQASGDKFLTLLQNVDDCKMDQPIHLPKKDFRIKLELFYCGERVLHETINLKSGLRLAVSGCATSIRPDFVILPASVENLLANEPQTVYLPLCGNLLTYARHEPIVNHILTKSLSQGLLLWMNDDCDILAFRFCPGAIYHVSRSETSGKPVKIPLNKDRPEVVTIFRYADGYKMERDRYVNGQRRDAPDVTVYLSFGEPANADEMPERVFVCSKITLLGHDDDVDDDLSGYPSGEMVNDVEMEEPFPYNISCSIGSCTSSIPCEMEANDNDDDDDDDDESHQEDEDEQ